MGYTDPKFAPRHAPHDHLEAAERLRQAQQELEDNEGIFEDIQRVRKIQARRAKNRAKRKTKQKARR